jgi:hypothetical protein
VKVTVRDYQILQTIDPNVLEEHLQTSDWQKVALVYENTLIWHKKDDNGQLFEIKQPLRQEFDAPQLIGEAIKTLEIVENRSQLEILSDLITSLPNVEIPGWINKLHGEASGTCQVIVMGFVVGKLRKIHLELREADYQLALKAYEERSAVTCSGDLIKEDGFFVLKHPHIFAGVTEATLIK